MDESNRIVKVVYVDNDITKVLKGVITEEDLYTITLKIKPSNSLITVGKAFLVKIERDYYG